MTPDQPARPRPGSPSGEPLGLVVTLCRRLEEESIVYCHWKSNEAIDASAAGINDLDLLVARPDASRFKMVLDELDFRQARPRRDREVPALEDYLGRDPSTGEIVHVQPHYQLVLGDDMTKAFRLPVERSYLDSVHKTGLFPLPDPAFEYLVFLIRMVLKHCPLEAVLSGKGRLTTSERRELAHLESAVDLARVIDLAHVHLPFLEGSAFPIWRAAVEPHSGVVQRIAAGRRLERQLASHARRPPVADSLVKQWRRLTGRLERRFGIVPGKSPAVGGLIIAVVGGDGSGKSTLTTSLAERLGERFRVHLLHLGKPRRSLLTRGITRLVRSAPGGAGRSIRDLSLARDRKRTYVRARRLAGRGGVVIIDRFPLDGIESMDAPRLQGLGGGPIARWISDRERRYYDQIRPPDLLLVLKVPPDIAVARRSEQDAEFVRRRAAEIWAREWLAPDVAVLDASRSAPDVLEDATRVVWSYL